MKEYTVYTKRIAYELRKQGFQFIRIGVNENYPQFNTYVFVDSKELREAVNKMKAK